MKCERCSNELRLGNEQVGFDENKNPVIHQFAYCDNCRMKWDLSLQQQNYSNAHVENKPQKKKDSVLSILSCIFALFGCTCIVAVILAIIDLSINDKTKKHTGSWFAIVVAGIWLLIGVYNFSTADIRNSKSDTETKQSVVIDENEQENTNKEEINIISDKEILFMNEPWGISYTEFKNNHGELGVWDLTGESYRTFSVDEIVLGDYKGLDFDYNDINIVGNCYNGEIDVAGYKTKDITVYFAYTISDGVLNQNLSDSALYGARYEFDSLNLEEMYADLTEKLTDLYGEYSNTSKDTDLYGNVYTYTYWYGQNDTMVVLKSLNSENDSTGFYDDEIVIAYAWKKGDELLQKASDWLKEEATNQEKSVYGNSSTDGL